MGAASSRSTRAVSLTATLVSRPEVSEDGAEIRTDVSVRGPADDSPDEAFLPDLGAAILFHLYERKMFDAAMMRFGMQLRAQAIAVAENDTDPFPS